VAIFGKKLAPQTVSASSVPLPTTLGEVRVTVGGRAAALLFVSAGQINALIPFEVTSTPAAVVVTTGEGASAAYNIWLDAKAPALFTMNSSGSGAPLIFDAVTWQPAPAIDTTKPVVLLATGLGQTTPPGSSTAGGSSTPPFNEIDKTQLKVNIGETPAEVLWAGLMPGYPGIYQINVKANGAASTQVYLQQGTAQSNVTNAGISPGANVGNVTGSIGPLIPPGYSSHQSGPAIFSLAFQGVVFSVAFDILPAAKPFVVAAVAESASATIRFDPAAGTYEATLVVPIMKSRAGDFSQAGVTVYQIVDKSGAICAPAPGNLIPGLTIDPADKAAWNVMALPNVPDSAGIGVGYVKKSGSVRAGSRVTSGDFTYDPTTMFGGFMQIPCANPFATKIDTLKLFVDGKLIASKEVSYSLVHR
jgi:uncharacterized protein (TIGR03437 family)